MRLLVTGAHGMLGRRVTAEAQALGHAVLGLGSTELDVTDAGAVHERVLAERPHAVINCAAHTDVDGAESDEPTATRVNGAAAGHLADACTATSAMLVHVSTDYVFAGDAHRPYVESDPVGPRTAYGRSKLAGEQAIAAAGTEHAIVRSAWLFGAGGANFVDTMLALAATRDEVSVVADQVGCPTWTGHLAPALVEIAERRLAGLHHVAGGGSCSWYELAIEVFHAAGLACRVLPTTTEALPRPAPRPRFSVLASERPDALALPAWALGVSAHLAERVPA